MNLACEQQPAKREWNNVRRFKTFERCFYALSRELALALQSQFSYIICDRPHFYANYSHSIDHDNYVYA